MLLQLAKQYPLRILLVEDNSVDVRYASLVPAICVLIPLYRVAVAGCSTSRAFFPQGGASHLVTSGVRT